MSYKHAEIVGPFTAPEWSYAVINGYLVIKAIPKTNTMNAQEAIEKLEKMQRQIVCGSRIFSDIADLIRDLHRALADLQAQADECCKLLAYDDGDLLSRVTRYQRYAEGEIELRDQKAKAAMAYIEKLQVHLQRCMGQAASELQIESAREVLVEAMGKNKL